MTPAAIRGWSRRRVRCHLKGDGPWPYKAHTRWMGGGKRRQGMFCESREKGGKWPCHAEDRLRVFGRGEKRETNPGSRRRELLAPLCWRNGHSLKTQGERKAHTKEQAQGHHKRHPSKKPRSKKKMKTQSTEAPCFAGCVFWVVAFAGGWAWRRTRGHQIHGLVFALLTVFYLRRPHACVLAAKRGPLALTFAKEAS